MTEEEHRTKHVDARRMLDDVSKQERRCQIIKEVGKYARRARYAGGAPVNLDHEGNALSREFGRCSHAPGAPIAAERFAGPIRASETSKMGARRLLDERGRKEGPCHIP